MHLLGQGDLLVIYRSEKERGPSAVSDGITVWFTDNDETTARAYNASSSVPSTGPTYTFSIVAASGGYNRPGGAGSLASGSTGMYTTPGGKNVTIQHCRAVGAGINFAISGAAQIATDLPSRIVATKQTGGVVERTFTPRAGSLRTISAGIRQDYDPTSGAVGDVFVNGQTIQVELYY